MSAFIWNPSFLTGIASVDEQHSDLVEIINKFGDLLVNNELSTTKIESVFQELHEYTRYHFQEEEQFMESAGVAPQFLSKHRQVHQQFLDKLSALHEQTTAENLASLKTLFDFLIQWLAYHILGMDKSMAEQIAAINSGCSAEHAYQVASSKVHNATETLLYALNNLFEQVSERNKELFELNKNLELKVAQRTEELQQANAYLEKLAVTDVLTKVPNRRFAMSHLAILWQQSQQQNKPLSCLMIDADYFKQVNDKYGHDAGDKVLIELSKLIKQSLRTDDIVCRLGGDEFLVICENTDCQGAHYIAQVLCEQVAQLKVETGTGSWHGSVSIGVASKTDAMQEMEELIKRADQGVYLAKEAGKGCVKSCC